MPSTAMAVHSDPEILGGVPVFVGTRVPFRNLIDYLEGGTASRSFSTCFPPSRVSRRLPASRSRMKR
jgi:uncharacterized protein (DUF433 family)